MKDGTFFSFPHGKQENFDEFMKEVLKGRTQPEDLYEIAAILESMGWNDERALKEFGAEDLFELSARIWEAAEGSIVHTSFASAEKPSRKQVMIQLIRPFLRGLIFAFPMAVSVISMLTLQYSLWAYEHLSLEQATAIAIGTILSFITVGGFTQAIARRGFFYMIQGYYNLAKKNTFLFIRIGFLICILISLLIFFSNVIFNFFPYKMLLYIIVYFFFLNAIWLSVTVMYILEKEIAFTGLIIFGIFIVFILFELVRLDIIVSQVISLCIVSVMSMLLILYYFKKEERKSEKAISLKLPRVSITIYSVAGYFFYGFLYFTFLFVDRLNAWSANEEYMPYVIWFRGTYELGLDFALLALIIPMGVSEVIVSKLMRDLEACQKGYLAIESENMYRHFLRKYQNMFAVIIIAAVLSAICIYKFALYYNEWSVYIREQDLLASDVTQFVLFWGILSYMILSICLMNAVILFALSQPNMVIYAILPALLINILAGFLLTRWFHYQYAVFGLLLGTIYMSVVTTYYVRKVIKNVDYYLYAAS
ncbi:hypothetical protein [Priestia abyssalis]|uniref:hypothetical protein n=1 Tax=Priestia abyssalis TaxID=1221450 RepID=UPI0009957EDF|nr:hypothetical protein [Priestia abyssalis]